MSDKLLQLAGNPQARKLIKSLGLPVPMPQSLRRGDGPWRERELHDRDVLVGGPGGQLLGAIASTLARSGANPHLVGDDSVVAPFVPPGEAFGRAPLVLDSPEALGDLRPHGIVFDASGLSSPDALRALYEFFQPRIKGLAKCGRVVVVGRPPEDASNALAAAARTALEGFVRACAKEIGRSGATAQLLYVAEGAEARLPAALRFFLSDRSAFVTAQPVRITNVVETKALDRWTRPLEGQIALVTGAARGIGKATAQLLADEGAHVVCLDRPADDGPLSQVARELGGTPLLVDVTAPDAPRKIAEALAGGHGGVDIVVHNAGVTRDKTLGNMSEDQWDLTLNVNLAAIARITAALLEGPLRRDGRIICLASVAGIAGNPGQTNYAASKAGVIGYVRALAKPLAARGVTVNAIAPGFIETRMTGAMPVMIREAARRLSALGQGGQPVDVAAAITFLASPGAVGITGSVLRVCGGALIGA